MHGSFVHLISSVFVFSLEEGKNEKQNEDKVPLCGNFDISAISVYDLITQYSNFSRRNDGAISHGHADRRQIAVVSVDVRPCASAI